MQCPILEVRKKYAIIEGITFTTFINKGVLSMSFETIRPQDINENVFDLIGSQWMLVTAGDSNGYNTMTASWGGMGVCLLYTSNREKCFLVLHTG